MKIRSLFISDCHIGSDTCNHDKILKLISEVECEYVYLVGDFIDGWALSRRFKWHSNYNTIFQKLLRLSRKGAKVFYIWGNHDDFLENYTDISLGDNVEILRETSHVTLKGERVLILHGDQFDGIIAKHKWLQEIGSIIYDYSLLLNKLFRVFKFSFSNFLKSKAKEAVKYIANYEFEVALYCKINNFSTIIAGHIHKPELKLIDGIKYINTGDWVESNTFVVETIDGDLKLLTYEDFIRSSNRG